MPYLILPTGEKVVFDRRDASLVRQYSWHRVKSYKSFYAACSLYNPRRKIYMHRLILGVEGRSPKIDHKDLNGLNNRRRNLRAASDEQNHRNEVSRKGSSKYKGVSWVKAFESWQVTIRDNKKNRNLGYFKSEVTAAKTYDKAARKLYGKFARLNFPKRNEQSALRRTP